MLSQNNYPNLTRHLISCSSPDYPKSMIDAELAREDTPIEALPQFVAIMFTEFPLPRLSREKSTTPVISLQAIAGHTHHPLLLLPELLVSKVDAIPGADPLVLFRQLANLVMTLPTLLVYDHRDNIDASTPRLIGHPVHVVIALAALIVADLGDPRRADGCNVTDLRLVQLAKTVAHTTLACLDAFYAGDHPVDCQGSPDTLEGADEINYQYVSSTLNLLQQGLYPMPYNAATPLRVNVGMHPSLRLRFHVPASIAFVATLYTERIVWMDDQHDWIDTLPDALNPLKNQCIDKQFHPIFSGYMPRQPSFNQVPIGDYLRYRSVTSGALLFARAVIEHVRRAQKHGGYIYERISDVANRGESQFDLQTLIAMAAIPPMNCEQYKDMDNDACYNAELVCTAIEQCHMYWMMNKWLPPMAVIEHAFRPLSTEDESNPLSYLLDEANRYHHWLFSHDIDARVAACLDPLWSFKSVKELPACFNVFLFTDAHKSARVNNPDAAWRLSDCIQHYTDANQAPISINTDTTIPLTAVKSPLQMIYHRASMGPTPPVLLHGLQPGQVRAIALSRYISKLMHGSALGRPGELFDMETDARNGCAMMTPQALRLCLLRMMSTDNERYIHGKSRSLFFWPLTRELLTIPPIVKNMLPSRACALFADEMYTLMCNTIVRGKLSTKTCKTPDLDFPQPPGGFMRARLYYTKSDDITNNDAPPALSQPSGAQDIPELSGLGAPIFELLVRALLLGDHHRDVASVFDRTSAESCQKLSDWMLLAQQYPVGEARPVHLPEFTTRQLLIRFAYLTRIQQIGAISGVYTRASAIYECNAHLVHAIQLIVLQLYENDRRVAAGDSGAGDDMDAQDRMDDIDEEINGDADQEHIDEEREDDQEIARLIARDCAATHPDTNERIWYSEKSCEKQFLHRFFSIPRLWFEDQIQKGNRTMDSSIQSDRNNSNNDKISFMSDQKLNSLLAAARYSTVLGLRFNDAQSIEFRCLPVQTYLNSLNTVSPINNDDYDDIDKLFHPKKNRSGTDGRQSKKRSGGSGGDYDSDGGNDGADHSKAPRRKHRIDPNKLQPTNIVYTGEANGAIERLLYDVETNCGKLPPNVAAAQAKYRQTTRDPDVLYQRYHAMSVLHNVVSGTCPDNLMKILVEHRYRYPNYIYSSYWKMFIPHLIAFVLSFALHADKSALDNVDATPIFPEKLINAAILLTKPVAQQKAKPRTDGLHKEILPFLKYDASTHSRVLDPLYGDAWTVDPTLSSLPALAAPNTFGELLTAMCWMEVSIFSYNTDKLISPAKLVLPNDGIMGGWLQSALPMMWTYKNMRYGIDWPSVVCSESEFKQKYYDLSQSEELRNSALMLNSTSLRMHCIDGSGVTHRSIRRAVRFAATNHLVCPDNCAQDNIIMHEPYCFFALMNSIALAKQQQSK